MLNKNKILLCGLLVLILFQLAMIALIIQETHWLGPVQDFWGSIPFIEKTLSSGNWFGADLWIAQNNHRLALPRLAFLIDYRFFSGSNVFLSALGLSMMALEAVLLWILLKTQNKKTTERWIILLAGLAVITMPLVVYNLLHTFNTQWLQCAALAFLACLLFATGLEKGNRSLLIAGIVAAMACNFTTFTLTSIWPALFLLLWLYRTRLSCWLKTIGIAVCFAIVFVFFLPMENISGGHYELPSIEAPLTEIVGASAVIGLLRYVFSYLTLPNFPLGNAVSTTLTLLSLLWLITRLLHSRKVESSLEEKVCLALMFFCLCLAITTALGRAFMGSVGLSPRFGPIVLLYWMAFVIHLLLYLQTKSNKLLFDASVALSLFCLILFSVGNALDIGRRLSEDYNRFVIPQMAELNENWEQNAVYENMVPEWRETSYPGIFAAIPYLQSAQRGVFSSSLAQFINRADKKEWDALPLCGHATLTQKPRNQDPLIRNLSLEINFSDDDNDFSHLIIYSTNEITGLAFRKRQAPLQALLKPKNKIWVGISNKPLEPSSTKVLAFSSSKQSCRLQTLAN